MVAKTIKYSEAIGVAKYLADAFVRANQVNSEDVWVNEDLIIGFRMCEITRFERSRGEDFFGFGSFINYGGSLDSSYDSYNIDMMNDDYVLNFMRNRHKIIKLYGHYNQPTPKNLKLNKNGLVIISSGLKL